MDFLLWLQNLRTPAMNEIVLLLTNLGTEISFIAIAFWFLWCKNKQSGFRQFPIFFTAMTLCEALKSFLRIERPWVQDSRITPVEGSVDAATGYSCPSGHTTCGASTFIGAACFCKKWGWWILYGLLTLITMFSRLYLGVHTLTDVFAALLLSAGVAAAYMGAYALCDKGHLKEIFVYIFLTLLSVTAVVLTQMGIVDSPDGVENAPKLLGCSVAVLLGYLYDKKKLHFDTSGTKAQQVVKYTLGLALVGGVLGLCKWAFAYIFPVEWIADMVRYFLVLSAGAIVWPMTFGFWDKLFHKTIDKPKA